MQNILVVEDSPEYQRLIAGILSHLSVTVASSLGEAREKLGTAGFDLIVLDVSLPDGSGFDFVLELQKDRELTAVPLILLTSRSESADKVLGLSLGAEDYITKPFDPFELRARVDLRLKKLAARRRAETLLVKGNLRLNLTTRKATLFDPEETREETIDLTPFEFKLLVFFASNEEQVFSRNQLMDEVWGNQVYVLDRTVDAHISNLRKKIKHSEYTIQSLYGSGYAFSRLSQSTSEKTNRK